MRSSHGKGEYAPHGALLCRRRAMGSNDLPPYALSPTLRKPAPEDLRLNRPHLRRCLRSPQRPGGLRSAHRMGPQLRGGRGRGSGSGGSVGSGSGSGSGSGVGGAGGSGVVGGGSPGPGVEGVGEGGGPPRVGPGAAGSGRGSSGVTDGTAPGGVGARAASGHGPVRVGVGAPDAPPGPPGAGNRVPAGSAADPFGRRTARAPPRRRPGRRSYSRWTRRSSAR